MEKKSDIKIMAIDDEEILLKNIKRNLNEYDIVTFSDPNEAAEELLKTHYDIFIIDQKMPKMNGSELVKIIRENVNHCVCIMLSAHIDTELVIDLTNEGLINFFINKSVAISSIKEYIELSIQKIKEMVKIETEIKELSNEINIYKEQLITHINSPHQINIITQNKNMKTLIETAESYSDKKANVLITGQSGTGKELFAQLIHFHSMRKDKPIIKINCSAIPDPLFESELFGHEKGAFTGAYKEKKGKFEQANGGTIFLDEMGDLPLGQQAKLLRILEDREIVRIGGSETIKLDIRVISATNKDLNKMMDEGKFRQDLYFRLNVLNISIPSLEERPGDKLLLCSYYLTKIAQEEGGPEKVLDGSAAEYLEKQSYPGNIRELKNSMHRLYSIAKNPVITLNDILKGNLAGGELFNESIEPDIFSKYSNFNEFKDYMEKSFILKKLSENNSNINKTAKAIGIAQPNLSRKMKELDITI